MTMEVESVWDLIDEVSLLLPSKSVPLHEALGLTLSQDAIADMDHPPFDRSAFDGYAVGAEDFSEVFTVIDTIKAGESKIRTLQKGEAVRIMTGAELPSSGLKILMQENVTLQGTTFRINRQESGLNIRFRGEDYREGNILLQEGCSLGAAELAMLASLGITKPHVVSQPRILHFTGGDEIVASDTIPSAGKIRDSNSILIRALLEKSYISNVRHVHLPDDISMARKRIDTTASAPFDVLLFSGGASVGDHDFTRQVLKEMRFKIHCDQINMRPGRPLIFASRGQQIAFGIPGNPVSHFVCYHLFIARALARLMRKSPPALEKAVLAAAIPGKQHSRVTFWPARIEWNAEVRHVFPVSWNSSGDLASLIGVKALIRIGADENYSDSGMIVDCLLV